MVLINETEIDKMVIFFSNYNTMYAALHGGISKLFSWLYKSRNTRNRQKYAATSRATPNYRVI